VAIAAATQPAWGSFVVFCGSAAAPPENQTRFSKAGSLIKFILKRTPEASRGARFSIAAGWAGLNPGMTPRDWGTLVVNATAVMALWTLVLRAPALAWLRWRLHIGEVGIGTPPDENPSFAKRVVAFTITPNGVTNEAQQKMQES
jgi:hypothetical protein